MYLKKKKVVIAVAFKEVWEEALPGGWLIGNYNSGGNATVLPGVKVKCHHKLCKIAYLGTMQYGQ